VPPWPDSTTPLPRTPLQLLFSIPSPRACKKHIFDEAINLGSHFRGGGALVRGGFISLSLAVFW
jgi:hypothetical protein